MSKNPGFTWKSESQAKLTGHFSPIIPSFADRGLSFACTWRHLEAKVGTSKGGGKQWQTTPKKLPRMQCARAIPVAWLGSGSCQNRPSGWILMMMMVHQPPSEPGSPLYRRFLIILRHTTLSTTLLGQCLDPRRHLHQSTHNTHNRQTTMPPAGSEPAISASERPQGHVLDRSATEVGHSVTDSFVH